MILHKEISNEGLRKLIRQQNISLAGNIRLKIYGRLNCASGKRMKRENRIFFTSAEEANINGFRPCGNCMKEQYKNWKMDLFNNDRLTNLLPYDGTVIYFGKVLPQAAAENYFNILMDTIEWKNDEAVIFGRHIITKRKVAWYGDAGYMYTYSNITKQALVWTKELLELKLLAEELTGESYNSCLLNLYHDGSEGMAWHSDDEKTLATNSSIASFSFGAVRNFSFRNKKNKERISLFLEAGSLLEMKGTTQQNWLHRLPPTTKFKHARINLTFRRMEQ